MQQQLSQPQLSPDNYDQQIQTNKQTNKQTTKHTNKHTNRQTHSHTTTFCLGLQQTNTTSVLQAGSHRKVASISSREPPQGGKESKPTSSRRSVAQLRHAARSTPKDATAKDPAAPAVEEKNLRPDMRHRDQPPSRGAAIQAHRKRTA
jgi:hypothetical protein